MTSFHLSSSRGKARRTIFVGVVLAAMSTSACGSDEEPDFADPDLVAPLTNPDGILYPTDNIGGAQRTGKRRGDRFPNFAFHGYRDGDRSAGLQTIAVADFYDPEETRSIKVLHILVGATWCSICSSELEATVRAKDVLREEGVVFLEVVVGGNVPGKGPSLGEFDAWVARHGSNVSTVIDVRARRLSMVGVHPAAMPHDILIDARTMEILDSSVGAPSDVAKYVREGVRWVKAHPPSY